jgi:hypothetical protein
MIYILLYHFIEHIDGERGIPFKLTLIGYRVASLIKGWALERIY